VPDLGRHALGLYAQIRFSKQHKYSQAAARPALHFRLQRLADRLFFDARNVQATAMSRELSMRALLRVSALTAMRARSRWLS
jgi:hypothetical protein